MTAFGSVRHCRVGRDKGKTGQGAWRNLCLRIRNGIRAFEMTKDEQYREKVRENLKILIGYQLPNGRMVSWFVVDGLRPMLAEAVGNGDI